MCSRKWFVRLGALLLSAALLVLCAFAADTTPLTDGMLEANSNRQAHPFSDAPVESQFTTEGFEKVGETQSRD